jgi:hypothetical protein
MQVTAKTGDAQADCAKLAGSIQAASLVDNYARLTINFEPVTGGLTPVLTMCASTVAQGAHAVEVTREAHNLLSRNSAISQGAVIGDSAVSFSVKLVGDTALCKVLPPVVGAKTACGLTTTTPGPANIPATAASGPVGPTSTPVATNQNVATSATCTRGPVGPVSRQAMRFDGKSRVTSSQGLDTGGDMTSFTAEVVVTGDVKNGPEATLMSYDTDQPFRGFSLWGPQSLHAQIGSMYYQTGVNVEDGKDHRLTMSWQQSGGTLVLYDNGREVWRKLGVNTGGTIGSNGRMMIGETDESAYWGPGTYKNPYSGTIVNAALARQVVTAAQAASGPLHNVFQASSGLLTDVVMGPDGKPIDTTGRATYTATGGVSAQSAMVNTSVYRDKDCP